MADVLIRDAVAADAEALAEVCIMAGHGVMQLLYEGLLPGKSLTDIIIARRLLNLESFAALPRWRVVTDLGGEVLGGLNSFPHEVLMNALADPLIDAPRLAPIAALSELEATATQTYFVNVIAIFPSARGTGAGYALMQEAERLARAQNFRRMALGTFGGDEKLISFYRRQGFEVVATRPMAPHPIFETDGDWALMQRELRD